MRVHGLKRNVWNGSSLAKWQLERGLHMYRDEELTWSGVDRHENASARSLTDTRMNDRLRVSTALTPTGVAIACVDMESTDAKRAPTMMVLHIDASPRDEGERERRTGIFRQTQQREVADHHVIRQVLGELLINSLSQGSKVCERFTRHIVLALFAIDDDQAHLTSSPPSSTGGLTAWQLQVSTDILTADLQNSPSLQDVARACGLSTSHFGRAFRKTMGMPPHRWLLSHRLERAKELLKQDRTLADIACECGFSEQSHMTHAFSNRFGVSPGAWRRALRATQESVAAAAQ